MKNNTETSTQNNSISVFNPQDGAKVGEVFNATKEDALRVISEAAKTLTVLICLVTLH